MRRVADFVGLWVSLLFQHHKSKKIEKNSEPMANAKIPFTLAAT
jgi:hypothetical protein